MTPQEKSEKIKEAIGKALDELPADGKPDALLFMSYDEREWDYDIPEMICGLPVYHHSRLTNDTVNWGHIGIPWVPVWKNHKKEAALEYIENFNDAYAKNAR